MCTKYVPINIKLNHDQQNFEAEQKCKAIVNIL